MLTFLIAVLAGLICGVLSGFGIGGGSLLMVWLTAAQSMEFACEHTLLSKKYEKQVQTCWYGEHTSTLEVKLFVNLETGVCRVWFCSDGRRDAYKERWYSTLGKRTYNAIAETVKNAGFEI